MIFDIPDTADLDQPATQAIQQWNLDPERVRKAMVILSYGSIRKTVKTWPMEFEVRSLSSDSWYTVSPDEHTCTCPDTLFSPQICKHRIAVYLYEQRLERQAIASPVSSGKESQLLEDIGF